MLQAFLPPGAVLLSFNGYPAVWERDLNGDGVQEIICGYQYNRKAYVLILALYEGQFRKVAEIEGKGYDLSFLQAVPVTREGQTELVVGWQAEAAWSMLSIYRWTSAGFQDIAPPDTWFSKLEVEDLPPYDGRAELALWSRRTAEAYEVEVYRWEAGHLQPAADTYPAYFPRVVAFYQANRRDDALHLYHLAEAQEKAGDVEGALRSLDDALTLPGAVDLQTELMRLRSTLLMGRARYVYPASLATEKGLKWGYIDEKGRFGIMPEYDYALPFQQNGMAAVQTAGKYGLITMSGKYAVPPRYDSVPVFRDGRASVVEGVGFQVIDERGRTLTNKAYSYIGSYQDGRAVAAEIDSQGNSVYGYLDRQGREAIPLQYKRADDFYKGKAVVQLQDNSFALIDQNGRVLQSYKYGFVGGRLGDGLLPFAEKDGGPYGYMDESGKVAIPPQYAMAGPFSEGYAVVNTSPDTYGLIDRNGRFVIQPQYASIRLLGQQRAAVGKALKEQQPYLGKQYAIADITGTLLTDFVYRDVEPYENGLASAFDGQNSFFLDTSGKAAAGYPVIEGRGTLQVEGDLIRADIDQKLAYYQRNGQLLWLQSMTTGLGDRYVVREQKYKPNPDYLVYYPIIEGMRDEAAQQKVNEKLRQLSQVKPIPKMQLDYTYSGSFSVSFFQKDLAVLKLAGYTYYFGAAHGMPTIIYAPVNLVTGEIYQLQDLFRPGSGYVKVLSDSIAKKIQTDPQYEYVFPDSYKGIAANQPFYLDNEALYVYFTPYEIAPYAAGFPTFIIPYTSIQPLLNTEGSFWRAFH